jgi:hypothetical protein
VVFSVVPIFVQIGGHGQAMVGIRMIRRFMQDFAVESSGILRILGSQCGLSVSNQSGLSFDGRQFSVGILCLGICVGGQLFLAVHILRFGGVICRATFLRPGPQARNPLWLPRAGTACEGGKKQQRQNLPVFEHRGGSRPATRDAGHPQQPAAQDRSKNLKNTGISSISAAAQQ